MNKIIILIIILLVGLMMLSNKKVSLLQLFVKQIKILKNAQTDKLSIWDVMCFIIFPVVASVLIVFGLNYQVDVDLAEILTTVFSLVFTILFGFAAVIVEKSACEDPKKKRVVGETFVSIITSTVLSLFAAVISILLTKIETVLIISILSIVLLTLAFIIMMLLLMITKRTFKIYCEGK